ncbi:hypothetical protein [Sphingomonas sp.]|jgi:hypothetical protein|uniref:hypothetical protein n=1 Tax=Sphingomonas sp. TaxID=28214 RepID=UPI002E352023|nr:hypothetical protein [Sphingomonas sp.]HEX4695814.1 hypothetical protein [Sphingomonas sp.]
MLTAILLSAAAPGITACPPPSNWSDRVPEAGLLHNTLRFERGRITWNHVPVDEEHVQLYLFATTRLDPQPRLVIDTASMDCATLSRIVAMVERANVLCANGMCVAADLTGFEPPPPPAPPAPRR